MRKTKEQIQDEIKALEASKGYAPERTMFGENNHAKIDAQIRALSENWGDDELLNLEDEEGEDSPVVDAAREAMDWRDGHNEEAPSSGWDIYKK